MSTWTLVLVSIGLFAGLHVVGLVGMLLNRVLRPISEIKRYADDTLAAGLAIARHLDAVDEAARTRELTAALPGALEKALE
jgi:hypothetical protein